MQRAGGLPIANSSSFLSLLPSSWSNTDVADIAAASNAETPAGRDRDSRLLMSVCMPVEVSVSSVVELRRWVLILSCNCESSCQF